MARARELLAARYREVVGLGEVAAAVRCSPAHLCRVFKAHLGVPVLRYLHRLRVAAAVDRLRQGEDDLSRLALDLGYDSHSHFTRVFRREVGATPSEVRRALRARADGAGKRRRTRV